MPNAYTPTSTIELTDMERAELTSMARSRSLPTALSLRARIVLACEGPDKASTDVATTLGIDRNTVNKWRARYARNRLPGLYDELRPGRPRTVDDERRDQYLAAGPERGFDDILKFCAGVFKTFVEPVAVS